MKTRHTSIYLGVLFSLLLGNTACHKLDFETAVDPVAISIEEGSIDMASNIITVDGNIEFVGDNIKQYGHIWSTTNNLDFPNIVCELENISCHGNTSEPTDFTSEIVINQIDVEYKIIAYAVDVHDCIHFSSDTVKHAIGTPIFASFEVITNLEECYASCSVFFKNNSTENLEYKWYVDGELKSQNRSLNYDFPKEGVYSVLLEVIDDDNVVTDSATVIIKSRTFPHEYPGFKRGVGVINIDQNKYLVSGTKLDGSNTNSIIFKTDTLGSPTGSFEFEQPIDYSTGEDIIGDFMLFNNSIIAVGQTYVSDENGFDVFTSQYQLNGNTAGDEKIRAHPNSDEYINAVIKTSSGKILMVGNQVDHNSGDSDIYLLELTSSLSNIPEPAFPFSNYEVAYDVIETSSGYFIVGSSDDFAMGLRLDNTSNPINSPITVSSKPSIAFAIEKGNTNELFLLGRVINNGQSDVLLLKTDEQGTIIDDFSFDDGGDEIGMDLIVLSDGNIVICGEKSQDAFIAKYNVNTKQLEWLEVYGDSQRDLFTTIAQTPDCGFILTGEKNGQLFLLKTNSKGKTQ